MRRILAGAFGAFTIGAALVWAQPEAAAWLAQKPSGAAAFSGAGDITTFDHWGSTAFGYSAAYAASGTNPAFTYVCTGQAHSTIAVLATGLVDRAALASDCGANTITLDRLCDQAVDTSCTKYFVATSGSITINLSAIASNPCMVFTTSSILITATGGFPYAPTGSQPLNLSAYAERTSAFTAFNDIMSQSGGAWSIDFNNAANQVAAYAGTLTSAVTANDSAFHAFQFVLNGTNSAINVDGSDTTGLNAGTVGFSGTDGLEIAGGNNLNGIVCEAGVFTNSSTAWSSTVRGNLATNQAARY